MKDGAVELAPVPVERSAAVTQEAPLQFREIIAAVGANQGDVDKVKDSFDVGRGYS